MRKPEHTNLLEATASLRERLALHGTRDVAARFTRYFLGQINNEHAKAEMSSPARQCAFAMSVLLSTPDPAEPAKFDDDAWSSCVSLLERIFEIYASMYWPGPEEQLTPRWYEVREVAMPAFLHYFNTGRIASSDQVTARIRRYLVPFDNDLERLLGISASEALRICDTLHERAQADLDTITSMAGEERKLRESLIIRWRAEGWNIARLQHETSKTDHVKLVTKMVSLMDGLQRLDLDELVTKFGPPGQAFWDRFSTARSDTPETTYLTDNLQFDATPLIRFNDRQAALVLHHHLYTAVLDVFEDVLSKSNVAEAYFAARDRIVEEEVALAFERLLPGAVIHRGMYETAHAQHEHDAIVFFEDACFVVEVKASPPPEPFRDAEKAFERIRRAFRSDRGLQKAYDQASRLWVPWANGQTMVLFDKKGIRRAEIAPGSVRKLFLVCVTRDDYGPLAADLSLLLDKSPAAPYAWAPNIFALDFLADGWADLDLDARQFMEFLEGRIRLHGKVFGTDELEFAGYYVRHGSLTRLVESDRDRIVLDPSYSHVFDQVWLSKYGHPPVKIKPTAPVEVDFRELLRADAATTEPRVKQRRNEPCACGSGKKYKKCCGKAE